MPLRLTAVGSAGMSARLWLLRHGDAEPHGEKEDALRELTATGLEEARTAGIALSRLGAPQVVLTSPRLRAQQTAAAAAAAFEGDPQVELSLSGGFRSADATELVLRHPGQTLLLVGHMPDLSLVIGDLSGAAVGLRTGGLAELRGSGSNWELVTLLRPRDTGAIAAGSD